MEILNLDPLRLAGDKQNLKRLSMHELGITQEILNITLESMEKYGLKELQRICVTVGELQHLESECLQVAFEASAAKTPARGALLEIVRIPVKAACLSCGQEFSGSPLFYGCPGGCAAGLILLQGDELYIDEIEGI